MDKVRMIEVKENILENNDRDAAALRALLKEQHTCLMNLMSSPGSGKTTTLLRTIDTLRDRYRIGIIEADIDSDVDAEKIAARGIKAMQLHTGGACHLDAGMTRSGVEAFGVDDVDFCVLENIGNLVCPAEFDTGAAINAMILSVPEGDDKPLKYPLMFTKVDVVLINKIDVAHCFDFDFAACRERIHALKPDCEIFELSAKTGEGFEQWTNWLAARIDAAIK